MQDKVNINFNCFVIISPCLTISLIETFDNFPFKFEPALNLYGDNELDRFGRFLTLIEYKQKDKLINNPNTVGPIKLWNMEITF